MVRVPSAEEVAAKWASRVAIAGPEYEAGVSDPGVDWAGPTKAAESRYKEGVTKAANAGLFGKGVAKAGNEKWKTKTTTLGVARWSTGVSAATGDYAKGMAPVLSAEAGAILPPRYAAGDERNYERSKAMGKAVHNATKGK
jgi:hypothetical protein